MNGLTLDLSHIISFQKVLGLERAKYVSGYERDLEKGERGLGLM